MNESLKIIPGVANLVIHVEGDLASTVKFFDMIAAKYLDPEDWEKDLMRVSLTPIQGTFDPMQAIDNLAEEFNKDENEIYQLPKMPLVYNTDITMEKFNGETLMCLTSMERVRETKVLLYLLLSFYAKEFPNLKIYFGYSRAAVTDIRTKKKIKVSELVSKYMYNSEKSPASCKAEAPKVALYSEDQFKFAMNMMLVHPLGVKLRYSGMIMWNHRLNLDQIPVNVERCQKTFVL